jgi:hypothetical protein
MTDPGPGTTCSPRPLISRVSRDALTTEARGAAAEIETRHDREPAVNYPGHAVEGDRSFSDVGGQHHLANGGRCESRILLGWGETAVKRENYHAFREFSLL